jgi:hypothetical protein
MAEEEGFEPPIPFQVRQFSRLEPSTTRPLFLFEVYYAAGECAKDMILAASSKLRSARVTSSAIHGIYTVR